MSIALIRNITQKSASLAANHLIKSSTLLANTRNTINYNARPYSFRMQKRSFISSKEKPHSPKLSKMVSSPELIKEAKAAPKPSKLKELTKKYGAAGIMVYLAIGCVDLGVTLGVIYFVGLEKVKTLEESVLEIVYKTGEKFGIKPKNISEDSLQIEKDTNPSFASVFILAYSIHKTLLLPVRLGITAAITPPIVRKLHQLGWTKYFPRLFGVTNTTSKKP